MRAATQPRAPHTVRRRLRHHDISVAACDAAVPRAHFTYFYRYTTYFLSRLLPAHVARLMLRLIVASPALLAFFFFFLC